MSGDIKRLYRSMDERMLAGVCGGLAEYFNMDPTLVRLLFVLFSVVSSGPPGIVVYIALAIIIPEEPTSYAAPSGNQPQANVEVELDDELE